MKNVFVLVLSLVLLLCAGCIPYGNTEIQTMVDNQNATIDTLQDTLAELAKSGAVNEERVANINEEVDRVQEHVTTVVAEVQKGEDPLDAAERGWKATEPFNPYYGYGLAALSIAKLFSNKRREKETEAALEEVVIGVEKSKKNGGDLKDAFRKETLVTMDKVSAIRNRVA